MGVKVVHVGYVVGRGLGVTLDSGMAWAGDRIDFRNPDGRMLTGWVRGTEWTSAKPGICAFVLGADDVAVGADVVDLRPKREDR